MLSKKDAILYVRENYHLFINQTEPDTIMPEEDFKKAVDVVLKKCGIAQVSSIIKIMYSKVVGSLCVCVFVCVRLNNSGTAGPIWLNFFLLAPSWSRGGFRLKNFRIRDPVFPEIRKNPYFRVLFDQFG